jgi:hypothetical protein
MLRLFTCNVVAATHDPTALDESVSAGELRAKSPDRRGPIRASAASYFCDATWAGTGKTKYGPTWWKSSW